MLLTTEDMDLIFGSGKEPLRELQQNNPQLPGLLHWPDHIRVHCPEIVRDVLREVLKIKIAFRLPQSRTSEDMHTMTN